MKSEELSEKVEKIEELKQKLKKTTNRSMNLLQNFIDDQNEDTLTQSWFALEIITNVLEDIQEQLVKINLS